MMIKEIIQDTSQDKWWKQNLKSDSIFFYLLTWEDRSFMKFGFKFSQQKLKEDYSRKHHIKPSTSNLWIVEAKTINNVIQIRKYIDQGYLRDFVRICEGNVHRKLKLSDEFTTSSGCKEFYEPLRQDKALKIIRQGLRDFEKDFVTWKLMQETSINDYFESRY